MFDPEIAGRLFLEIGILELVQSKLTQQEALPGMRETSEGVQLLQGLVTIGLRTQGRLDIYVTHDAILAVLVASLFGLPLKELEWPNYLDGLVLWRLQGRLHFSWRGLQQASHPVGS